MDNIVKWILTKLVSNLCFKTTYYMDILLIYIIVFHLHLLIIIHNSHVSQGSVSTGLSNSILWWLLFINGNAIVNCYWNHDYIQPLQARWWWHMRFYVVEIMSWQMNFISLRIESGVTGDGKKNLTSHVSSSFGKYFFF